MELVAVVAALALVEYCAITILTGQARGRGGVPAPAMSGAPVFDRWIRVQGNTVEQLIVFLPALYLFAVYVSAPIAAALGLVFIAGRALYARAYVTDPARRGPGFLLTFVSNVALLLGGLVGALIRAF